MSEFIVSARKYRPSRFDEVVGQQQVSQTLKNALRNQHLAHAFLFCGPRGVGKTTCARILAKVLNCENLSEDKEACNTCSSCTAFNENASFNIHELDAASNNSVEHIRALIEQVRFQPQQGKYKVYIIDEVHMLSQQAFNAFLKTLEEPPPYAIFILATTEKHKIIPTILSRCQIFDFNRIQVPDIVSHLEHICTSENITADKDALHIIAQKADGALRDALSIFDRIVSFSGDSIRYEDVIHNLNVLDYDYYFKFTDAMLGSDLSSVLLIFDDVLRKGFDPSIFIIGFAEHLRNLLVCKDPETLKLLEVGEGLQERYGQQAALSPSAFLLSCLQIGNDCDVQFKMARNKRLHVEMALMKMCYALQAVNLASLHTAQSGEEKKKPESELKPAVESKSDNTPPPQEPAVEKAKNISTPETEKPKNTSLGSLSLKSLKNLHKEVEEAEKIPEIVVELTQENLTKVWNEYVESIDSQAAKTAFAGVELTLEDKTIQAIVSSSYVQGILQKENDLMTVLRTKLNVPDLSLSIQVDKNKAPKIEIKKPTILTDKEKYLKMCAENPALDELRKRFDLRPEG